jgi:hypothetical protein
LAKEDALSAKRRALFAQRRAFFVEEGVSACKVNGLCLGNPAEIQAFLPNGAGLASFRDKAQPV